MTAKNDAGEAGAREGAARREEAKCRHVPLRDCSDTEDEDRVLIRFHRGENDIPKIRPFNPNFVQCMMLRALLH